MSKNLKPISLPARLAESLKARLKTPGEGPIVLKLYRRGHPTFELHLTDREFQIVSEKADAAMVSLGTLIVKILGL